MRSPTFCLQERGENISSGGLVHLATPNGFRPFDADHGDIRGRWYTAAGACCVHWLFAAGQRRPETYTLLESTKMSSNLKLTLSVDRAYKSAHASWQRSSEFEQKWKEAANSLLEFNMGEALSDEIRERACKLMTYPSFILKLSAGIFGCEMNGAYYPGAIEIASKGCHVKHRGEVYHSAQESFPELIEAWLLILEEGKDVREMTFKELVKVTLVDAIRENGWSASHSSPDQFII